MIARRRSAFRLAVAPRCGQTGRASPPVITARPVTTSTQLRDYAYGAALFLTGALIGLAVVLPTP